MISTDVISPSMQSKYAQEIPKCLKFKLCHKMSDYEKNIGLQGIKGDIQCHVVPKGLAVVYLP